MRAERLAGSLRRGGRLVAIGVLLGLAACKAPIDETWLHVTGFKVGDSEVSVVETPLSDETTKMVTIGLENGSDAVGSTAGGVAIIVKRARVSYSGLGVSFPTYEYPVALYLEAPESGKATTGSLTIPVASAELKAWMRGSGRFPAPPFQVSATVTLFAETEEGRKLETSAGIAVMFK